jgi:hypothetical protein
VSTVRTVNGRWLLRGRDGSLSAYAARDEAVWCRAERHPGLPWGPARRVGGDQRLHAGPGIGQGSDGYAHLAAWRPTVRGESGLVHSTHFRPHLSALDWTPIGHPDKTGDRTGVPAVAVDDEGRAHVFVRNKGGGVSMVAQKEKGGWEPWRDLEGSAVQEELAAVTGESGRVEVYAAVSGGILHWRQQAPGEQPVLEETLEAPVRPGTLHALATSPDSTTLFYLEESGGLCAWRPGGKPVTVLASAGPGRVCAVRRELDGHDCTLLAQRSAGGRAVFAAYPTGRESAGASWTESGPRLPADAEVSLTVDADDRVVAAAFAPSTGELLLARRTDGTGLALQAWQPV